MKGKDWARQTLIDAGHDPDWEPKSARMTDAEHRIAYSRLSVLYKGLKPFEEFCQDERMAQSLRTAANGSPPK